jgi:hypothetical protein
MKNKYDKGYKKIKEEIAFNNKEITSLYHCGIKNRNLAWEQGIKKYDDKNLNAEILGFKNKTKKNNILNKMLNLLHDNKNKVIRRLYRFFEKLRKD